jgi:hypothetical protein
VQRAMLLEGVVLAIFVIWTLRVRGRLRDEVVRRV